MFEKRGRVLLGAVLFLFLALSAGAEPSSRVLVVLPPAGESAGSESVEEFVKMLKAARQALSLSAQELPLLRLSERLGTHQRVLTELGVALGPKPQLLLCRRASDGWPAEVLAEMPLDANPFTFLRDALDPKGSVTAPVDPPPPSPAPVPEGQLGFLLVYPKGQSATLIDPFLSELGRHWVERYGRVKPAPYPLAFYDSSDPLVAARLQEIHPELLQEPPLVAICSFSAGRPTQILETFRGLEFPATLVRELSAARTRHLADSLQVGSVTAPELPGADSVTLSPGQHRLIALSRLHELARQLWSSSQDGEAGENRIARRVLLQISELGRETVEKPELWESQLREVLADYRQEPLRFAPGSELESLHQRFLYLVQELDSLSD